MQSVKTPVAEPPAMLDPQFTPLAVVEHLKKVPLAMPNPLSATQSVKFPEAEK